MFTQDGNGILSPVDNRISHFDLVKHASMTYKAQNERNIAVLAVCPNETVLIAVDEVGKALVLSYHKKTVLTSINFKGVVTCAKFSPDSKYMAIAIGNMLHIYYTPVLLREYAPLKLAHKFSAAHDDILTMAWSPDSNFLALGGKDTSVRIYSVLKNFTKRILSGHRDHIVSVFFDASNQLYSIAKDGAMYHWGFGFNSKKERHTAKLLSKYFFEKPHDQPHMCYISCADYHTELSLLVVGFNNGVFSIYQVNGEEMTKVHSLNISSEAITSVSINRSGDWIAFGCAKLGQVLVWEWKAETYVLKQQGHLWGGDAGSVAYTPNGQMLISGGYDGKVKLWNPITGYCFATFADHKAGVTDVCVTERGNVVLSASLDGTVKAMDLVRYRNFRTLAAAKEISVQFQCVTCDPSGDIVCAGGMDPFVIYCWSLRTGKVLDVMSGHEGPVVAIKFAAGPNQKLVSGSWDKTVRVWDLYTTKSPVEVLEHSSEVVALDVTLDGKTCVVSTMDGQLSFWNLDEAKLEGVIEGRRDVIGGRRENDARSFKNSEHNVCFTTVSFSPDGTTVIAAGNGKYVCIYSVDQKILLRKFQITENRSLDGVLDYLNSKQMTPWGSKSAIDDNDDDVHTPDNSLPGVRTGDFSSRKTVPAITCHSVKFCPTGQAWCVSSTSGMMLYALDGETYFDPVDLDMDLTPQAIREAFNMNEFAKALLMSLRLNEERYVSEVIQHIPIDELDLVLKAVPSQYIERLLLVLSKLVEDSIHLEFYLHWSERLFKIHGKYIKTNSNAFTTPLRSLQKSIGAHYKFLSQVCSGNQYQLDYLVSFDRKHTPEVQLNDGEEGVVVKRSKVVV